MAEFFIESLRAEDAGQSGRGPKPKPPVFAAVPDSKK